MKIQVADKRLRWDELDINLCDIDSDWHGERLSRPVSYGLAVDLDNLWFVAGHHQPASIHPDARTGVFQPELWRYDVAEFFLSDPTTGKYLEFNLAPNGAWWSATFIAPRVREHEEDAPFPEVATYASLASDGSWITAAVIPLKHLRNMLNFGDTSKMNVTFIVNSPDQKFITATKLSDGEPDYHLPDLFKHVTFCR